LNGIKKILKLHIGVHATCFTIGAAMVAFQVATPRAFPKQIVENVQFGFVFAKDIVDEFCHCF
jgi:hypothetical protein